jgi:hypothetical protein
MRPATLRTLERVASAPAEVDRDAVRSKLVAEVARLDEAFALPGGVLSVGEAREQARGVLRAFDAGGLEEDDLRAIAEAYTVPS